MTQFKRKDICAKLFLVLFFLATLKEVEGMTFLGFREDRELDANYSDVIQDKNRELVNDRELEQSTLGRELPFGPYTDRELRHDRYRDLANDRELRHDRYLTVRPEDDLANRRLLLV